MYNFPILSLLIFLPAAGAVSILLMEQEEKKGIRRIALTVTFAEIFFSFYLYFNFIEESWLIQFEEKFFPTKYLGSVYHFGIDGINLGLILLTVVISFVAILVSNVVALEKYKEIVFLLLIIESAIIGFFCSQNFLPFSFFGEITTFSVYKIFSTDSKKKSRPNKFLTYNFLGTIFSVSAVLFLYFSNSEKAGIYTFEISKYYAAELPNATQFWLFLLLFLSFAVKTPLFPFHSWINDTYSKKSPLGSLMIGTLFINIGAFCFLKLGLPILPKAAILFGTWVSGLVCMGILYTGLIALAQENMMIFLSYLTLSQIGFVTLGFFSFNVQGIEGSLLHMINNSLSFGTLLIIYSALKSRGNLIIMRPSNKISHEKPKFTIWLMIPYLSIMAFPLTCGFVSTLFVLTGIYKSNRMLALLAFLSVLVTTASILRSLKNFPFDPILNQRNKREITREIIASLSPLIVIILLLGFYPKGLIGKMTASVIHLIEQVKIPPAKKERRFQAQIDSYFYFAQRKPTSTPTPSGG